MVRLGSKLYICTAVCWVQLGKKKIRERKEKKWLGQQHCSWGESHVSWELKASVKQSKQIPFFKGKISFFRGNLRLHSNVLEQGEALAGWWPDWFAQPHTGYGRQLTESRPRGVKVGISKTQCDKWEGKGKARQEVFAQIQSCASCSWATPQYTGPWSNLQ